MEVQPSIIRSRFHLINENAQLQANFDSFLHDVGLFSAGTKYNILSIIGSQSSGKSTLLNRVFKTEFDELNSKQARQQTTRGVWVSRDCDSNLIVLDVEGSDSKERWDDRNYYEHSTALFSLALSHVLVINIWTNEIGRFQGSQYGILKVVLEMNIKLFKQESTKKIIFLLRDFSSDDNLQAIRDTIMEDVSRIWREIEKPEEMQKIQLSQVFDISIEYLEHIRFAKAKFDEGIMKLKDSFTNPSNPRYYFQNFEYSRNLPIVALPGFISNLWGVIKDHKDINLPAEKIIIANLRCEEIRRAAEKLFRDGIESFKSSSQVENFGTVAKECLEKARGMYEAEAYLYFKDVYETIRGNMIQSFMDELFNLFQTLYKKLKLEVLAECDRRMQSIQGVGKNASVDDIKRAVGSLKQLLDDTMERNKLLLNSFVIDASFWDAGEAIEDLERELLKRFQNVLEKMKDYYIESAEKKLQRKLEIEVLRLLEKVNLTLWDDIKIFYEDELTKALRDVSSTLRDAFMFNELKVRSSCELLQKKFYDGIVNEFNKKKGDLIKFLMKNFKESFTRDEKGEARAWDKITVENIEKFFVMSKENTSKILENLRLFKLSQGEDNIHLMIAPTPSGEIESIKMRKSLSSMVPSSEGDNIKIKKAYSIDEPSFRLYINGREYEEISVRFMDLTDDEYSLAMRRHSKEENDKRLSIPFYILLALLGYEEVLYFASSWFVLIPLLILTLLIALVITTGYGSLINNFLEELLYGLKKKARAGVINAGTSLLKKRN